MSNQDHQEPHESREEKQKAEIDKYWNSCNSDCRMFAIIVNSSNMIFQLKAIFAPIEGSNQLIMNIIYTIVSLISYIILALSFRKEYGVSFSYYSIIIILLRQAFRFLDLEDTKGKMSDTNWNFVLLWQIVNNCSQIAVLSIMFSNNKYNKIVLSLCSVITIVCGCYG